MSAVNGQRAAHPTSPDAEKAVATSDGWGSDGLTKREYFAGLALQGILANSELASRHGMPVVERAADAVEYADALLAELAK